MRNVVGSEDAVRTMNAFSGSVELAREGCGGVEYQPRMSS